MNKSVIRPWSWWCSFSEVFFNLIELLVRESKWKKMYYVIFEGSVDHMGK